jgi:hypothetical protein
VATGRIGTTPALGFRWSESPAGGTTSLSGLDDNSVGLSYTPGNERVYRNGVLLSRGSDYTATDGTTITLEDATITGDIIEVFSQDLAQLTDAISKSSLTAKGTLLSASAASTLAVLGVGANDTVLTADSAETTGLKWAAPAGAAPNGYTLLNAGGTALTGATTITVSGISGQRSLLIRVQGASSVNASSYIGIRVNADSGGNYDVGFFEFGATANNFNNATGSTEIWLGQMSSNAGSVVGGSVWLDGTNTTDFKALTAQGQASTGGGSSQLGFVHGGIYKGTSAITSVSAISNSGNFDAGTLFVYGAAI